MYHKHGRYWYVKAGHWHKLSKDKSEAFRQYLRITSPKGGVADLIDKTIANLDIKESTRDQYLQMVPLLKTLFSGFAASEIDTQHIYDIKHRYKKKVSKFNRMRSILISVFQYAVERGECRFNPVREVPPYPEKGRDKYLTDDEYLAIRAKARPWLQIMMDLAYYTGQRVSDIIMFKESDVRAGEVYFRQRKTDNRVEIELNESIQAAVKQARALHKTPGIYLFRTKAGKPYSYYTVRDAFRKARIAAGVENAQFRDIRAKAATDAERDGINPTLLLGHSSPGTTKRYLRNKRTIRSTGLSSIRQVLDNLDKV